MYIKKYAFKLLLLIATVGLSTSVFAQNHRSCKKRKLMSRQEFMSKRADYIIKEADLTKNEAKVFLTLWDELHQKQKTMNDSINIRLDKASQEGLGSEKEYHNIINRMSDSKVKRAILNKEYIDKMLEIIPAKKLFKVLGAEMKFRRKIFKQYGHQRSQCRTQTNP